MGVFALSWKSEGKELTQIKKPTALLTFSLPLPG